MIQAFNVGQGDSFNLKPQYGCTFDDIPLLIGCGPVRSRIAHKVHEK